MEALAHPGRWSVDKVSWSVSRPPGWEDASRPCTCWAGSQTSIDLPLYPHLPGEGLLSATTFGEGGKMMPLIFANPNYPEAFLPSTKSHGTSSHFRYLGWDQAPTSNMEEGGVPEGCAFSQPSDDEHK